MLSDANDELIRLYQTVADDCEAVLDELRSLVHLVEDSEKFYQLRSADPQTLAPAARAARFIFLNKTGFNGLYRVNRRGEFNVPFGKHDSPPRLFDEDNFRLVSSLFKKAELSRDDFETILERAGDGDFAYLDPPYVPLSATASFTGYTSGSFSTVDQARLAESVHRTVVRGCFVLLSNSDTPLVHQLYGWYTIRKLQAKRSINSDPIKRQKIAEVVVEAFPVRA